MTLCGIPQQQQQRQKNSKRIWRIIFLNLYFDNGATMIGIIGILQFEMITNTKSTIMLLTTMSPKVDCFAFLFQSKLDFDVKFKFQLSMMRFFRNIYTFSIFNSTKLFNIWSLSLSLKSIKSNWWHWKSSRKYYGAFLCIDFGMINRYSKFK